MSVTDELDALIEELDHAVDNERGADAPDGVTVVGEPNRATPSVNWLTMVGTSLPPSLR